MPLLCYCCCCLHLLLPSFLSLLLRHTVDLAGQNFIAYKAWALCRNLDDAHHVPDTDNAQHDDLQHARMLR